MASLQAQHVQHAQSDVVQPNVPNVPDVLDVDGPQIGAAPWLTHRRLLVFVIGWLMLFAVIGAFLSNPFQSEPHAGATPDYATVMFLHGLLIGMVGLASLLTCQVFRLRSTHVRVWITAGVVVATILAAVGGIWDKSIPGAEVPMWTQIFGFFALDEILLTLLIGLLLEWRRSPAAHTLPYVAAALATASMLIAALMGHLAGWIMEFGNTPTVLGNFAQFAGFGTVDDFAGALVGSHSHEMAVGVMALTIVLAAQQFGYGALRGVPKALARTGVGLIALGTLVMTAIYLASAISQWAPPPWFVSGAGGANGIASDDVVTGTLVMGGGVLVVAAFAFVRSVIHRPLRVAAMWAWVLSFATVVIAGFSIELNEVYFGAGDQTAAGASNDAIFTWLHQDIGLFLLPATVLVMLVAEWLIRRVSTTSVIGWATIAGTSIAFVGSMVYVFVDPALHGTGYVITSIGLVVLGAALLATLWWGAVTRTRVARVRLPGPTLPETVPLWPMASLETFTTEPTPEKTSEREPIGAPTR
jgi:hypothetical protein